MQDCSGCWFFQSRYFSALYGHSGGCTRWPNRIAGQRMNGIFYLVGLVVLALIVVYALHWAP